METLPEIENFQVQEYLIQDYDTQYDYAVLLSNLKPVSTNHEIFHMKLKYVDMIKQSLSSGDINEIIEVVSMVQGVRVEAVKRMKIVDFFGLLNSIKEQITTIIDGESNALVSNHIDHNWDSVNGSEKMEKFGIYNTLWILSNGDPTKFEDIMEMSYSDVFTVLYMKKIQGDLEHQMNQIQKNKK